MCYSDTDGNLSTLTFSPRPMTRRFPVRVRGPNRHKRGHDGDLIFFSLFFPFRFSFSLALFSNPQVLLVICSRPQPRQFFIVSTWIMNIDHFQAET